MLSKSLGLWSINPACLARPSATEFYFLIVWSSWKLRVLKMHRNFHGLKSTIDAEQVTWTIKYQPRLPSKTGATEFAFLILWRRWKLESWMHRNFHGLGCSSTCRRYKQYEEPVGSLVSIMPTGHKNIHKNINKI
jgi:hypothetical protein